MAACTPPPAPFTFNTRKERIDWGALHGVDADAVVRRVKQAGRGSVLFALSPGGGARTQPPPSHRTHTLSHFSQAALTDVEALERCVAAIAFGDLDAEPGGRVSEVREKRRELPRNCCCSRVVHAKRSLPSLSPSLPPYRSPSAACSGWPS